MPQSNEGATYAKWGRQYGELRSVVHMRVLNRNLIVLNTLQAAIDLLDKRSHIYSDRPWLPMVNDMLGWGWAMSSMPYGEGWRERRRVFHHHFHLEASKQYRDLQTRSNIAFLRALSETPNDFIEHIRTLPARNIMSCTYGIDVADKHDPWVELADTAVETISGAGLPGSHLVDWLPFLKHIPAWLPGAQFKRDALKWQKFPASMRGAPFDHVKSTMRAGGGRQSIVASLLQNGLEGRPLSEELIADVAGVTYLGGADTTVSAITAFFLCMVLSPEKQKLAQQEIDSVLGHGRLPEHRDRESLPYVNGILLEVLRLYPVFPLNIPRRALEEDEYEGMRIPKGATILTNIWGILRDKNLYAKPDEFKPERYIGSDGRLAFSEEMDPRTIVFGFGRRICPGRHFADDAMWLTVATVLACFNIAPAKDDAGYEIIPDGEMRPGTISGPRPFVCSITPRSLAASRLVAELSEQL
ncbi:putative CyP450 monooxygenase [Auricularia subglabra TFB-10046 SS5]|nr:putative CyP450 monooxygenase [Auricularia subglabra TFB-10046 SS5]